MNSKNSIVVRDFPGGPGVKNLPSSAGDVGLIPGQGTKIPHAVGQVCLSVATRDVCVLQLEKARKTQGIQNKKQN